MSSDGSHDPWLTKAVDSKSKPEALPVSIDEAGPKVGDRLGSYELLALLGKGGMGLVFRARHSRLRKEFALKVLSPRLTRDPDALRRFDRETEAMGRLEHAHLVRASDAGVENGTPFVVMELLEGVDLAGFSKPMGRWPIAEACEVVRQAALGLQHAYERGLVHRDIKPSNLWLTPEGIVKVLDLGLARLAGDDDRAPAMTAAGVWMGTPDYVAPEQILDSRSADTRADIYSLGCTLFYLLSGEPPFGSSTHPTLRHKSEAHVKEAPPNVRQRRAEVPDELALVLRRMLAKRPEDRYQTPAEVVAALTPFAQNARLDRLPDGKAASSSAPASRTSVATCTARPAPKPQPPQPNPSRPRWYWGAAAAGIVLGGIGLALWLVPWDGTTNPSSQSSQGAAEKVHVLRLSVDHLAADPGQDRTALGLLGKDSFRTHVGERVRVEAQLSRPAYAFLIAFRPDGSIELCYPEKEDEPPAESDRPRYPAGHQGAYGLTGKAGLQAFGLVVSHEPLPCYRTWLTQCASSPWERGDAPPAGVVWRANGSDDPIALTDLDWNPHRVRGWDVPSETPVARLASWLRHAPQVDAAAVLAFAVLPKGEH